jgi:hypothetical protein
MWYFSELYLNKNYFLYEYKGGYEEGVTYNQLNEDILTLIDSCNIKKDENDPNEIII